MVEWDSTTIKCIYKLILYYGECPKKYMRGPMKLDNNAIYIDYIQNGIRDILKVPHHFLYPPTIIK